MELVVEYTDAAGPTAHVTLDGDDDLAVATDAVALVESAGPGLEIWVHGATNERDELMGERGYRSERTLLQLRRALPAPPSELTTRAFVDADADELVTVNNRAFAWHPEQGGLTVAKLREDMAESWFDADGLRILELDDRIAGFCWTKVHREPEPLGEIYVIGLDPEYAGRGLGGPLTQSGLDRLHELGLRTAMLYVEADNAPALEVYRRLGFVTHRTDRLWFVDSADR